MQFEIDPKIIDSNKLQQMMSESVRSSGIPQRFWGGDSEEMFSNISTRQIKEASLKSQRYLTELNNIWQIHEVEITSHRKIIGPVIVFAKKAFRKLTRWLFSAYNDQETKYNYEVLQCMTELHNTQNMILNYIVQMENLGEGEHED